MIGQYLSNTNEIATVLILPKILELNKALWCGSAPRAPRATQSSIQTDAIKWSRRRAGLVTLFRRRELEKATQGRAWHGGERELTSWRAAVLARRRGCGWSGFGHPWRWDPANCYDSNADYVSFDLICTHSILVRINELAYYILSIRLLAPRHPYFFIPIHFTHIGISLLSSNISPFALTTLSISKSTM